MTKRERILVIATVGMIACAFSIQYGDQQSIRLKYKDQPQLYLVPQKLIIDSIAPSRTNIIVRGYSMDIPWEGCTHAYNSTNSAIDLFTFEDKHQFILMVFPYKEGRNNDFSSDKSAYLATPRDLELSLFQSGKTFDLKLNRLLRKMALLYWPISAVYEFHTSSLSGFQIGSLSNDSRVEIDAFDLDGNILHFVFKWQKDGDETHLDQAHINCIIQSLKKIANNRAIDAHD